MTRQLRSGEDKCNENNINKFVIAKKVLVSSRHHHPLQQTILQMWIMIYMLSCITDIKFQLWTIQLDINTAGNGTDPFIAIQLREKTVLTCHVWMYLQVSSTQLVVRQSSILKTRSSPTSFSWRRSNSIY